MPPRTRPAARPPGPVGGRQPGPPVPARRRVLAAGEVNQAAITMRPPTHAEQDGREAEPELGHLVRPGHPEIGHIPPAVDAGELPSAVMNSTAAARTPTGCAAGASPPAPAMATGRAQRSSQTGEPRSGVSTWWGEHDRDERDDGIPMIRRLGRPRFGDMTAAQHHRHRNGKRQNQSQHRNRRAMDPSGWPSSTARTGCALSNQLRLGPTRA